MAWTLLRSDEVGELLFSYSQDGGTTFLIDPIVLRSGSHAQYSPVHHGAAIALDATSNLYVTWVEDQVKGGVQYQDNASTIFVVKSTDGGASFLNISNPYVVKSGFNTASGTQLGSFRYNSFPSIAASPTTGYVHVAWCEYENGTTRRVHCKRSTNGGQSWVNEGTASAPITGYQQWSPFLSANSAGRLFLTFYNFLNSLPFPSRLYSQASTDNGISFGDSYSHATVDSDPTVAESVTDYIGAIAPADNPLPTTMWMDFRNGTPTAQRGDAFFDQKLHLASNVSTATAGDGQRKLVKGQAANEYHLVFEANGEVWYTKTTDGGMNWSVEKLLSERSGSNSSPCIVELSGTLYAVWQKKTGTNIYDIKLRYFNGASWENVVQSVQTGISSASDPTPAIAINTPGATFEMMVAYRTGSGLKSKRSTGTNGSTWQTETTIMSNTNARNPSLVYQSGAGFRATWDDLSAIYHQAYNGSSWGTATNVSGPAGSSASNSRDASFALAGNLDRHISWGAEDLQGGYGTEVIFHNKNLNPSIFTEFLSSSGYESIRPTITGHDNAVASMIWQAKLGYNPIDVRKARYNGNGWDDIYEGTVIGSGGFYPLSNAFRTG